MPQTLDLRRRMTAVSQTKKITGAMQIVSSTRMKRVMSRIEYNHRYFNTVQRTMKELLLSSRDISHPYLDDSRGNRRTCIVISGDKGLAGDYNAKVLEFALQYLQPQEEGGGLVTLGHTADAFFEARGITPDVSYSGVVQDPTLDRARGMLYDVLRMYESGLADEILVIYTSFYGETKNQPVMRRLLPIKLADYGDVKQAQELSEILYEPSAQVVFDMLVPQYVLGILFGVLVQAYASEHYARMTAMQRATQNADEMLGALSHGAPERHHVGNCRNHRRSTCAVRGG